MLSKSVYGFLLLCGATLCLLSLSMGTEAYESDDDALVDHPLREYSAVPAMVYPRRRHKSRTSSIYADVEQDKLPPVEQDDEIPDGLYGRGNVRCGGSSLRGHSKVELMRNPTKLKSHRVSGGYAAKPGQFPSFVSLIKSGHQWCGGTIIGPSEILTAAHCAVDVISEDMRVAPVTYRSEIFNNSYLVRNICITPRYQPELHRFDFAVLKLDKAIEFNEKVQPACLPTKSIRQGQAYAVGLGTTNGNPYEIPEVLQVIPVERERCFHDKHRSVICFRSNDENHAGDTCRGDSGGPVLSKVRGSWTVYGITSYGPPICQAGYPGLGSYANVYNLRSELNELMRFCV